ncbi:glycosyltransferase [Rhodococcus phenolicus]|uniref:glycosyltransferase n=1 Tax=Rhodococcus phenolicus TaxID=263849 RepID=UPI00082DD388|nr:glycosyltransferase [Rhodococcus phenolicus]
MIGYYIHHHGHGHRSRAAAICAHLRTPVTALSSEPVPDPGGVFADTVVLPRDDAARTTQDPTAHGTLHWVPRLDPGLRCRQAALAAWIERARPTAIVVDVSVEVTLTARLFGIPVVTVAMPGNRSDAPHQLAYRMSDRIVAAWPRAMYEPDWLQPFRDRVNYVGGISRFDGRSSSPATGSGEDTVLVLGGSGGSSLTAADLESYTACDPRFAWEGLGVAGREWVDDPWPALCRAGIVIGHGGQNTVADIAAARRPAVLVAEQRPFDEQCATVTALGHAGLAVALTAWPEPHAWPGLLDRARRSDPDRWDLWCTDGAAARAAAAIEEVADGRTRV